MKKIFTLVLMGVFCFSLSVSASGVERVKNLEVKKIYARKVKLEWQAVDGATNYRLKIMKKENSIFQLVKKGQANSNKKLVKRLQPETTYYFKVRANISGHLGPFSKRVTATTKAVQTPSVNDANIVFLHHSTGENIWNGGVSGWFSNYNSNHGASYNITETAFPKDYPYGWNNYPYDYWNIWVNNAGASEYMEEPTLEILTQNYNVIVFKHCFPVSGIEENIGADIASDYKSIENYKLQYNALKDKMHQFPDNKFVVWTGAALIEGETDQAHAERAQEFFTWVKNEWDVTGDNIYVFDFYSLETEGSLYMKDENSSGDSHPNETFSADVAPIFSQKIVDVINDN